MVCQAPLSDSGALLDVSAMPGIGFYTVKINAFTLPDNELNRFRREPSTLALQGFDAVDQWYAGLINNGVFTAYAAAVRAKQTPKLQTTLQVPLLRGMVAVLVIDALGRRTLWTGSGLV